jgi:hypothetical protein
MIRVTLCIIPDLAESPCRDLKALKARARLVDMQHSAVSEKPGVRNIALAVHQNDARIDRPGDPAQERPVPSGQAEIKIVAGQITPGLGEQMPAMVAPAIIAAAQIAIDGKAQSVPRSIGKVSSR